MSAEIINLKTPYTTAASFGFIVAIMFLIAHIIETRNTKIYKKRQNLHLNLKTQDEENMLSNDEKENVSFIQNLFFGKKDLSNKVLAYMIIQIILIGMMLFFTSGFITIISRFMLTYLTKGPGKFNIDSYSKLQTIYWLLYSIGSILLFIFS